MLGRVRTGKSRLPESPIMVPRLGPQRQGQLGLQKRASVLASSPALSPEAEQNRYFWSPAVVWGWPSVPQFPSNGPCEAAKEREMTTASQEAPVLRFQGPLTPSPASASSWHRGLLPTCHSGRGRGTVRAQAEESGSSLCWLPVISHKVEPAG